MSNYIMRVLTDGIAEDRVFGDYPHTAERCYGSTVDLLNRMGVAVETSVQLIVDGEVEYETTIAPDCGCPKVTCGRVCDPQ